MIDFKADRSCSDVISGYFVRVSKIWFFAVLPSARPLSRKPITEMTILRKFSKSHIHRLPLFSATCFGNNQSNELNDMPLISEMALHSPNARDPLPLFGRHCYCLDFEMDFVDVVGAAVFNRLFGI